MINEPIAQLGISIVGPVNLGGSIVAQNVFDGELETTTFDGDIEMQGAPGAQGPPGPAGSTLTAIAAVTLSGERVVITQSNGTLIYDDPTNLAFSEAAAFITTSAGNAGSEVEVVTYGPVSASFWSWVPGLPIFLGPNGTLTQMVPALPSAVFLLQVAVAETATTIFWDPQPSIVLA